MSDQQTLDFYLENESAKNKTFYPEILTHHYHTDKNKTFLQDLISIYSKIDPTMLIYYHDYDIAEGEHLTKLAKELVDLERYYDGIELTNEELRFLIRFKYLKQRVKANQIDNVQKLFTDFFGNKVRIYVGFHSITYFVDESLINQSIFQVILKQKLLVIPVDAYYYEVFKFDLTKKYIYFPMQYEDPIYDEYQSKLSENYNEENVLWLDLNNQVA
jgi:hypothetical protein